MAGDLSDEALWVWILRFLGFEEKVPKNDVTQVPRLRGDQRQANGAKVSFE